MITNSTVVTLITVVLEKLQISDATTLFVEVIIGVVPMVVRIGAGISVVCYQTHILLKW